MFTVLDHLEHTASRFPERVLCEDAAGTVSFADFVARAKRIGSRLLRLGTRRRPVAVCMETSAAAWAAMLGVVYSGNFYVVIDAATPIERIKSMFQTLRPAAVIADAACVPESERLDGVAVLRYDDLLTEAADEAGLAYARRSVIDADPVYALFTSGSTGVPKGAVVSHASVIRYASWYVRAFGIDERTVFGSQTPFHFSMSVSTMFSALLTGASLVVIPRQLFSFPVRLLEFMNEKRINTVYWVPSALGMVANFRALDGRSLPHLQKILFAGEVMPMKQLNYWRAHMPKETLFANLFGPTETTDIATYYIVDRPFSDDEPLPIGRPCENCAVLVLKADGTEAAEGEAGELCVRGAFLADGYYNNWEKTREAFPQNPLNDAYLERIYRTGDIVRYNVRGELLYLARKDFQIKHQGYRIELGEIEAVVNALEDVFECACLYDAERSRIVLYCVGRSLTAKAILQGVRDRLPKYMLPNKLFFLETMPRNANGKIDRGELLQWYKESVTH